MTELISSVTTVPVVLALCAIFIIMLLVVHKTIKDMSFFGGASGWIVAVCVAALSVVGLLRFFGSPGHATHVANQPSMGAGVLDFILLGYVALAICILLLLALRMVSPSAKPRHPDQGGRKIAAVDERRVKKGTDDHTKVSPRRRLGRGQATDHSIRT